MGNAGRAEAEAHPAIERFLGDLRLLRGKAENTILAYRSDLQKLQFFLATRSKSVVEANSDDLEAFADWLRAQRLAPAGIMRRLSAVASFYRFALGSGLIQRNPADSLARPKLPSRLPKVLTVEQIQAIVESPTGSDPLEIRDKALLELIYGAGLRISESAGLAIADLDLERREIRSVGKGGKERLCFFGRVAEAALRRYLESARPKLSKNKPAKHLFLSNRGSPLSREQVWRLVKKYAKRALPDTRVTPHMLRHSFATHLLQGGAELPVIKDLLGHSSIATTQIYASVTPDHLRESYAASHPRARKRREKPPV
jgi:integrase/recombinase XerD